MKGDGRITQAQIRKIHATGRELGLDGDVLHEHVYIITGKESMREMTCREAAGVIDSLTGKASAVRNPASTRQTAYITGMAKTLGWVDKKGRPDMQRLDGMCRKYTKAQEFGRLDKADASALIEALKNMQRQKREGA
jgi:phage gp16-like protein